MPRITIKNMVCNRCIIVARQTIEELGLHATHVALGYITLLEEPDIETYALLRHNFAAVGFELVDDKRAQLIVQIVAEIMTWLEAPSSETKKMNFSDHLQKALHRDYKLMSRLFSEIEGTTIEHRIVQLRIERVKELLCHSDLSIKEIAYQQGYSSPAHLSNQFKTIAGLTPGNFRKLMAEIRSSPSDYINV